MIASTRASGDGCWNTKGHTPIALLKKQFYRVRLRVVRPFHLRREEKEIDLNQATEGKRRQLKKKACHEVRERLSSPMLVAILASQPTARGTMGTR